MKNLLQLGPATDLRLVLNKEHWLAVADEIRRGRCHVRKQLQLYMPHGTISDATEAVQAVASAIRMDQNLESLMLRMNNGFTDEAGVALAEALTVSTTLRKIILNTDTGRSRNDHNLETLGSQSYEAFAAMLRVNASLVLELPPLDTAALCDERLGKQYDQMRIEQLLNKVGRARLLVSSQMTKEEWVDALVELSSYNVYDSPAFRVSCLYSLLRLNPATV
jgi:hypothetical protein